MLRKIVIKNYKSIEDLSIDLGRINVFIGENGAGKSNILEAIALAGAAQADKLDSEFLVSRGIRVSGPDLMRSCFLTENFDKPINIKITTDESSVSYELINDNEPYSEWRSNIQGTVRASTSVFTNAISDIVNELDDKEKISFLDSVQKRIRSALDEFERLPDVDRANFSLKISFPEFSDKNLKLFDEIKDFIVFSPENSSLRTFQREGQIQPLGINGEGLLKFLHFLSSSKNKSHIKSIKEDLQIFSWFSDFSFKNGRLKGQIEIFDKFLSDSGKAFDQKSANEGFLFVLFYIALFVSPLTPKVFAIDNIDSSLNPRICEELMRRLYALALKNEKQAFITTHNPAILDGIDLSNSDQRLFIISRSPEGRTKVRRFTAKPSSDRPRRLSELFMSGALGGLPKGF